MAGISPKYNRISVMGMARPWLAMLPPPSGSIGSGERATFAFIYAGTYAPAPSLDQPIQARMPYTPPKVPPAYTQQWIQIQLGEIARRIPPTVTREVVGDTTITVTDQALLCDTTSGNIDVTLLPADQVQHLPLTIKNIGTGIVTVVGTVDATVDPTLSQWQWMVIQSNGSNWYLLADG